MKIQLNIDNDIFSKITEKFISYVAEGKEDEFMDRMRKFSKTKRTINADDLIVDDETEKYITNIKVDIACLALAVGRDKEEEKWNETTITPLTSTPS